MDLTHNEISFMAVLWSAEAPLSASEILKRCIDRSWKDASLHTITNKLIEKGAIAEYGFKKDGKAIARTFVPAISCAEYYEDRFSMYPIKIIPQIISVLLNRMDLDAESLATIEKVIQEHDAICGLNS